MTPLQLFLDLARRDIGRTETPPGSNVVPGISQGQPWCARWICELLNAAGIPCPMLPSARALVEHWQRQGVPMPATSAPYLPGDLVLTKRHDADGHVIGYHVAIVVSDAGGPTAHVIAGNHRNAVGEYEQERAKIVGSARVC